MGRNYNTPSYILFDKMHLLSSADQTSAAIAASVVMVIVVIAVAITVVAILLLLYVKRSSKVTISGRVKSNAFGKYSLYRECSPFLWLHLNGLKLKCALSFQPPVEGSQILIHYT